MLPLSLPRRDLPESEGVIVIAADIGGTKTNLGLFKSSHGRMVSITQAAYVSKDYTSFTDIVKHFLTTTGNTQPQRLSAGVAGPVLNGIAEITNLPWKIHADVLQKEIGVKEIALLNDLEATAYGLAELHDDDVETLHIGSASVTGNIAIIAPGTGLGEAGLYWDGSHYHPFPTEGGHCFYAPQTQEDVDLLLYMQKIYGIVSWELVTSGLAIPGLYKYLKEEKKMPEPKWLKELMKDNDIAAVISEQAVLKSSEICEATMRIFTNNLAREACILVLKMKATSGLYLGGGIPPKIAPLLRERSFYEAFITSDRMEELMRTVPVKLILNSKTALKGAAYYGAFGAPQSLL